MSRENTSSVDMASGKKMAYFANQERATLKSGYYKGQKESTKQVVNSKKSANLALKKAKAKKKAMMAKASRKKNKR